jgi:hypothetical protein
VICVYGRGMAEKVTRTFDVYRFPHRSISAVAGKHGVISAQVAKVSGGVWLWEVLEDNVNYDHGQRISRDNAMSSAVSSMNLFLEKHGAAEFIVAEPESWIGDEIPAASPELGARQNPKR